MGNAGICGRCNGVKTVWDGKARVPCPDCNGTGLRGGVVPEDYWLEFFRALIAAIGPNTTIHRG